MPVARRRFIQGTAVATGAALLPTVPAYAADPVTIEADGITLVGRSDGSVLVRDGAGADRVLLNHFMFKDSALGQQRTFGGTPARITLADGRPAIQVTYTMASGTSGITVRGTFDVTARKAHMKWEVGGSSTLTPSKLHVLPHGVRGERAGVVRGADRLGAGRPGRHPVRGQRGRHVRGDMGGIEGLLLPPVHQPREHQRHMDPLPGRPDRRGHRGHGGRSGPRRPAAARGGSARRQEAAGRGGVDRPAVQPLQGGRADDDAQGAGRQRLRRRPEGDPDLVGARLRREEDHAAARSSGASRRAPPGTPPFP